MVEPILLIYRSASLQYLDIVKDIDNATCALYINYCVSPIIKG